MGILKYGIVYLDIKYVNIELLWEKGKDGRRSSVWLCFLFGLI